MVRRIYVQKKPGFDVEAKGILEDLKENLQIKGLEQVVILNRYDVSGVDEESYNKAKTTAKIAKTIIKTSSAIQNPSQKIYFHFATALLQKISHLNLQKK